MEAKKKISILFLQTLCQSAVDGQRSSHPGAFVIFAPLETWGPENMGAP